MTTGGAEGGGGGGAGHVGRGAAQLTEELTKRVCIPASVSISFFRS